tara:strand:- start:3604 stop:4185 length:582 start_codon:yes stop_codon:yes gene_type:complete
MATIYRAKLMKTNDQGLLSYVESNFDEQMLGQLIWDIQELYILPIVGTALYDELRTQIQAGTLTASNQTLLFEKINPALMWHLLSKGAHIFTYKIRNKGIVTQSSDNSQPATMNELDRMVKQFESFAQTYSDRLMKYLVENSTTFPLYYNAGDGVDAIQPRGEQYNVGWYFPRNNGLNGYNPCCNGEENTIDL